MMLFPDLQSKTQIFNTTLMSSLLCINCVASPFGSDKSVVSWALTVVSTTLSYGRGRRSTLTARPLGHNLLPVVNRGPKKGQSGQLPQLQTRSSCRVCHSFSKSWYWSECLLAFILYADCSIKAMPFLQKSFPSTRKKFESFFLGSPQGLSQV